MAASALFSLLSLAQRGNRTYLVLKLLSLYVQFCEEFEKGDDGRLAESWRDLVEQQANSLNQLLVQVYLGTDLRVVKEHGEEICGLLPYLLPEGVNVVQSDVQEELVVELGDGLEDLFYLIGKANILWGFIGVNAIKEVLVLVCFLSELAIIQQLSDGLRQGEWFCAFGHLEDDRRKRVLIDLSGEESVVVAGLSEKGATSALLSSTSKESSDVWSEGWPNLRLRLKVIRYIIQSEHQAQAISQNSNHHMQYPSKQPLHLSSKITTLPCHSSPLTSSPAFSPSIRPQITYQTPSFARFYSRMFQATKRTNY